MALRCACIHVHIPVSQSVQKCEQATTGAAGMACGAIDPLTYPHGSHIILSSSCLQAGLCSALTQQRLVQSWRFIFIFFMGKPPNLWLIAMPPAS